MSKIQLTNNFEIESDSGNNRLILRTTSTGQEFYFNDDGTLSEITTPSASTDAVNKTYADSTFVDAAGDSMSGDLSMGSNNIADLATPSQSTDAATKGYADSVAEGLDVKDAVRVCTCDQGNIDLGSSSDPNPVDTVTLNDGDRILLIEQTDKTENGIYDAVTADDPTTWVRSADADEDDEVNSGLFTLAVEGSTSGNVGFILITDDPITLGTTELDFTRFSGLENIVAGEHLNKTGSQIDVVDGPGSGLDADTVDGIEASALGSDVSNDGSTVTSSATDLDFTTNLTASDDGDGTSTIAIDDGPGSGLDADTVDGIEASALGSDVSNDGSTVTSSATDLDFTTNLTASDDGDGTSTIAIDDGPGSGLDADTVDGIQGSDISSIYASVTTETGAYTASDGDLVLADASSSGFTVTLPSPNAGDVVTVKKTDSSTNAVTIATPGAETIDGHSTITISAQFASRDFVSDGTNYFMV
jgi:hypothetical protein